MKRIFLLFTLTLLTLIFNTRISAQTLGERMKLQDSDTGYMLSADFLYQENMEMSYFDQWFGQRFGDFIKIQSDGKIGNFIGILKLDCNQQTFQWEKAVARTDESKSPMPAPEIKKAVPSQVTKNALALYCKR